MSSEQGSQVNLSDIIEEMFLVLTNKEKDVIIQRFSLDNKPKRTLESIGQKFSVTRERIRQIEKIALGKLRRTVQTTRLSKVNEIADKLVAEKGGVALESELIDEILDNIHSHEQVDAHIVRLALSINPELSKTEKSQNSKPFWRKSQLANKEITQIIKAGIKTLKKSKEVLSLEKITASITTMLGEKVENYSNEMLLNSLKTDKRIKFVAQGVGLMSWRHINPKSIRDKAYIILKKFKKPLHFIDIAKEIEKAKFDSKTVTVQAVHNELIRYDQFVLVGRGLYALREFGYKKGTVAEVIQALLEEKSPLSKQEIIQGVLKQRHVKKGTISLNLQKNPQFVRVGRAVYALDKSQIEK